MSPARPSPPQPPVELPPRVKHGSARAYNFYQCRCGFCFEWRRSYDRERWELKKRTHERPDRWKKKS